MTNPYEPAFPELKSLVKGSENCGTQNDFEAFTSGGMTKREYISAILLAGYMAVPDERICPKERYNDVDVFRAEMRRNDAKFAVAQADDLIWALNQTEPTKEKQCPK